MNDKISIVCVTMNAAKYISGCIDSILSQSYQNIEIVIFDGNSSDGTQAIIESYGDKISFFRCESDSGVYDAMNKALDHISGKWVYFLGADDRLLPEFSDFAKNELKDDSFIYYANVMYKGKKTKGEVDEYEEAKHGIFHQTIIYPAKVFSKYRYNLKYKVNADYALNLQLHGDRDFHFRYEDYIIARYDENGMSSIVEDKAFLEDKAGLILRNFGWKIKTRFFFRLIKSKLSGNKI
mgnify:CR=1 FL=1